MPKLKDNQFPSYRLHKQSGQAVVTLNGKDVLLGAHDTPDSRAKYDRVVAEWIANGRRLPCRPAAGGATGITCTQLIAEFWAFARTYYVDRAGKPSPEATHFRDALRF